MKNSYRQTHLDILRIMANFLVIFNHTAGFTLYQNTYEPTKAGLYMLLSIITKINVPVFFMISGALLLGKEEDLSYILTKRVFRFILLIVGASTFIYIIKASGAVTPANLFYGISTCQIEGTYWYLYAHLAFLLMLPYLRRIVSNLNKKDFIYILAIHFIINTILPIADYILYAATKQHITLYSEIQLPIMTTKAFFYPIIGYYIDKHIDIQKMNLRKLTPLFLLSIAGIAITEFFTFHQKYPHIGYTEDFFELFDYVFAIAVFVFIKYIASKYNLSEKKTVITKFTSIVAPLTLGIYLLDPCWKHLVEPTVYNALLPYVPFVINSFIYCFISMLLGGCATYLLKKIPFVNKIL